jgi:hypothetical protein
MTQAFEQTRIWTRFLATAQNAAQSAALERLRVAYFEMRRRAAILVSGIHQDCKGLTVHDISHLDALWDVADTIVGAEYEFTPAEVFVLGCAILIHDAGMAVAAFPGGQRDIEATLEWHENLHTVRRREALNSKGPVPDVLPRHLEQEILFATLRDLHASVAARLATQAWPGPNGEAVYLLGDEGLRSAYGDVVGHIAHSHHWDAERVLTEFHSATGAAAGLPPEWTLNEAKVALVLRCADAAHIDSRRAPTFRFAISRPTGVSHEHWTFQNKLKQVTVSCGELVYTSGRDFDVVDVPAWWQAYDTISMIHAELDKANNLLPEVKAQPFAVRGVAGANSLRKLARYIKPRNWEPVRADVTVSDPVALARTLGGSNLYGSSCLPAIRELLQNAADAVRARRKLERRDADWGHIAVTLEPCGDAEFWLHVDDTGIGMSQSVLTGPLIDFGKSIWNSPLLREEFPGLVSSGMAPIGKFGIGFFSVFLLGEEVHVVSKRFDQGDDCISVLQFNGLGSRPILRRSSRSQLPPDICTRVSVRVNKDRLAVLKNPRQRGRWVILDEPEPSREDLGQAIARLTASLDVQIRFQRGASVTSSHSPRWTTTDPKMFLCELYGEEAHSRWGAFATCYESMLRDIVDQDNVVVGRAALKLGSRHRNYDPSYLSVGGFTTLGQDRGEAYIGIFPGDVTVVARDYAVSTVSKDALQRWLQEQAVALLSLQVHDTLRLEAGRELFRMGARHDDLPICFFDNAIRSLRELTNRLSVVDSVLLPMRSTYSENFEVVGVDSLSIDYAKMQMCPPLIVFLSVKTDLFSHEAVQERQKGDDKVSLGEVSVDLGHALSLVSELWGSSLVLRITSGEAFATALPGFATKRTVLEIKRCDDLGAERV